MARRVKRGGKAGTRVKSRRRVQGIDEVAGASEHPTVPSVDNEDGDKLAPGLGARGLPLEAGALAERPDERAAAAEGLDGASRSPEATYGGGDGFDVRSSSRRDYESYMRGAIAADAERFESLRQQGAVDTFDPALAPTDVEQRGHFFAANHMVRLFEHWLLESPDRQVALEKASAWLAGFQRTDLVRKVLAELESKPIRDVYPLEVTLLLLETHPDKLPGVAQGTLLGHLPGLRPGEHIWAGHPIQLPVPENVRLKSFALLGGGRPGYEFFPSPKPGFYTLQVDTPGTWDFALSAVRTEKLGRMDRELPGGIVERFTVRVAEMGRKEAASVM